jgi:pimeloyl-ACP methyl ester carboxylesterase
VELGKGPRALLLTHQSGGNLCDWWPFARTLAQRGYRVLAIDLDYLGQSGKPTYDADVATAVRHLRTTGARRVAVVGLSLGGTVAVRAAAQVKPRLDAVASISGPAEYFGIDALPAAKRTMVPVLVVIAETDTGIDVTAVKALGAAARGRGSKLVVVPGSAHGREFLQAGTPGGPGVVTELMRFLATTLGSA